jgi:hypothetical protein
VVTVLAQYGNEHYRYLNFRNRWTPHVSHEIQQLRKGWLGFYEYRPYFSRVTFSFPPLFGIQGPAVKKSYKEQSKSPVLQAKPENYYGATGFFDWQTEPFGPPKPLIELEQEFSTGNSDSQEIEEEIVPVINTGTKQEDDFTDNSKENFNETVVHLEDENEDINSEEKGNLEIISP